MPSADTVSTEVKLSGQMEWD